MNEADSPGYPAKLSSTQFPGELIEGRLVCDRWALAFESDSAQMRFDWRGIRVSTAGGEEDQVFFSDTKHPDVTIFTETGDILNDPVFDQVTVLRQQVARFKQKKATRGYHWVMAKFLVGFAVFAVLLYLGAGCAVNVAVNSVSPEWERQLGQEVLAEIEAEATVVRDSPVARQLTQLAQRLTEGQAGVKHPVQVYVLPTTEANAFALPGGVILVTEGLIELANASEEVAGVIAHEIAHIQERHGVQSVIQASGPYYALRILFGDTGLARAVAETSQFLLHQKFSRAHEAEADKLACDYLLDAGIDPRAFAVMLERLNRFDPLAGAVPEFIQSHPPTAERIRAIESAAK